MRFFAPIFALFTATAVMAQTQLNQISNGMGTLAVSAGQNTIQWTNPSSGTVTIKLQRYDPNNIRPDTGIVLARDVPASALTYTIDIPADEVAPNTQYVYQIIDNTNNNANLSANFSAPFTVANATGSLTTASTQTQTTITMTSTRSSTITETETTMTGTNTNTRTSSNTNTNTRTSTSSTTTPTTSPTTAPGGGALKLGAHSGLLAVIMGAAIVL